MSGWLPGFALRLWPLYLWRTGLAMTVLMLAACATQTPALLRSPQNLPPQVELVDTPYFAQEVHQCGPASLAMALGAAGFGVTPEALQDEVYIPARQGSLQEEMLAAARRQGAFALRIKPRMEALLTEVASGRPVVILQNLGLSWLPRWHYAVVIGYDLPRQEILLRSGPNARESMTLTTFEHTWARSNYWGMLTLAPGQLPVDADPDAVADALVEMEKYSRPGLMLHAYQRALERWPQQAVLQMGAGNSAYQTGDLMQAETIFRSMANQHPLNAAALNNLAAVLQAQDRLHEALAIAERASGIEGPWQAQAQLTRDAIRDALRGSPQ